MEDALTTLRSFLVLRYDDLKRRLARRLGSTDLAGDALQDTYLRLEDKDNIGLVQNPSAYLFRMAFNIAIDHQRADSRLLSSDEIEAFLEIPDDAPGPARIMEARMEMEVLVRAIEELPERRRAILLAARLEGVPQKDIAERFSVSLRLVEKELQRAQEHCAKRLKKNR